MRNKQVLAEIQALREEIRSTKEGMDALAKKLERLCEDMDTRSEAADEMAAKANKLFEEGMTNLFGYGV